MSSHFEFVIKRDRTIMLKEILISVGLFVIQSFAYECGLFPNEASGLIQGGGQSKKYQWPITVSIEKKGKLLCAGTLVSLKHVLTGNI